MLSLSRLIWVSVRGGLFLFLIAFFSDLCQVGGALSAPGGHLFPQRHLRLSARDHGPAGRRRAFRIRRGRALAVFAVTRLVDDPSLAVPLKLGWPWGWPRIHWQVFDGGPSAGGGHGGDPGHPAPCRRTPVVAARTWPGGRFLAVILSLGWNRIWFEYPAPEGRRLSRVGRFSPGPAEVLGLRCGVEGFVLMALRPLFVTFVSRRGGGDVCRVSVLLFQHFFSRGRAREASSSSPPFPPVRVQGMIPLADEVRERAAPSPDAFQRLSTPGKRNRPTLIHGRGSVVGGRKDFEATGRVAAGREGSRHEHSLPTDEQGNRVAWSSRWPNGRPSRERLPLLRQEGLPPDLRPDPRRGPADPGAA